MSSCVQYTTPAIGRSLTGINADIFLRERLTVAVTDDIAKAVRKAAAARGLTVAEYVRGATQARLTLDGTDFHRLPNLQRIISKSASP